MGIVFLLLNVLIIILACIIINFKLKRRQLEKHAATIPGPTPLPIIGNGLLFFHVKTVKDIWETIFREAKKFDGIQKCWLGPKLIIVLSDPTYIEAVLSNPAALEKDSFYKVLSVLSSGIFTQNGKTWQALRKPLNKLLHPKLIENYQDIFASHTLVLSEKLSGKIGKGFFDIYELICYCTLDIICATHGGIDDVSEQNGSKYHLPSLLAVALDIAFQRVVKPQYYFDTIFYLTKQGKIMKRLTYDINEMARALVKKRLDILSERDKEYNENTKFECYTDVVINIGREKGLDIDQMAAWTTDFLVAVPFEPIK